MIEWLFTTETRFSDNFQQWQKGYDKNAQGSHQNRLQCHNGYAIKSDLIRLGQGESIFNGEESKCVKCQCDNCNAL